LRSGRIAREGGASRFHEEGASLAAYAVLVAELDDLHDLKLILGVDHSVWLARGVVGNLATGVLEGGSVSSTALLAEDLDELRNDLVRVLRH